jgi:hypothetical protein
MTVATVSDVTARLGRTPTPGEATKIQAYLTDAESLIRQKAPSRLTDAVWNDAVISVECAMVLRACRLPDALVAEIPSDETAGFPTNTQAQGVVYMRKSEMRALGIPVITTARITPSPLYRDCW